MNTSKSPRILSCMLCQQRKAKCNKRNPCSLCTKTGVQCIPSTPATPRRRLKTRANGDVYKRLVRCEELLKGHRVRNSSSEPEVVSPGLEKTGRLNSGPILSMDPGKLIVEHGMPRFLEK